MSPNHPSGTVAFLLTDIEDSTKLWERHPQEMPVAQERHNQIIREAIEANQGYVFQIIGDAFCAAFHHAGDAIRAAVKCQRDLNAETWQPTPIKARMGIHTGNADLQAADGSYSGYITQPGTAPHVRRVWRTSVGFLYNPRACP